MAVFAKCIIPETRGFFEMEKAIKEKFDGAIKNDKNKKEIEYFIQSWINRLVTQGDLSERLAENTIIYFCSKILLE